MKKTSDTRQEFDVAIIGGGIVGTALFSELVRAGADCVLLEASDDVSNGSSKANSGIVHSGYDPKPGTLMAKYNVLGNAMYPSMCERLGVSIKKCGTLLVGCDDDLPKLQELYDRGQQNGVPGLKIVKGQELRQMEPNLADRITCALYAPTGAIVSPYLVCVALAEEGIINGGTVKLEFEVNKITHENNVYNIYSRQKGSLEPIKARFVVNCAGASANDINKMLGIPSKTCTFVKGEYILLDKSQGGFVNRPIFPLPTPISKGILAIPTLHGNVMFGPTATPSAPDDTSVDHAGLDEIKNKVTLSVKMPNFRKTIKLFAGVRAKCGNDFVIQKADKLPHYFYTMGIQSPGLTAAPAIAVYLKNELLKDGLKTKTIKFISRTPYPDLASMDRKQLKAIIKKNPNYGQIICRCEAISLGEIIDVLHSPLHPRSIDAIKRRIRPVMGRCQGSFCLPKLIKIISKECNIPKEEVTLCGKGSELILANLKENGEFLKRKNVKKLVEKVKKS